MSFFLYAITWLIAAVAIYVLTPKPDKPKPPGINQFDITTVEEGRPVPVLFGTVEIDSMTIVGYGDVEVDPIHPDDGGKK